MRVCVCVVQPVHRARVLQHVKRFFFLCVFYFVSDGISWQDVWLLRRKQGKRWSTYGKNQRTWNRILAECCGVSIQLEIITSGKPEMTENPSAYVEAERKKWKGLFQYSAVKPQRSFLGLILLWLSLALNKFFGFVLLLFYFLHFLVFPIMLHGTWWYLY